MDNESAVVMWVATCITILGVVYFIFVRQDGTVLLSLSSILGGLAGYHYGKKRGAKSA